MSSPESLVKIEHIGRIAVLTLDNPPVNALGHALRSALKAALDTAIADPAAEAIVLIGAGRTFIAGADIAEFGAPRPEPLTPQLIAAIEAAAKPVVAALHGNALGGGLELAMSCHFRVAAPGTKLGQPEVKLGMLPGAGGSQRLPRLVGVPLALEMITGGEPITAERGLEVGLIDEIVAGDLKAGAVAFAEKILREGRPLRRVRDLPVKEIPPDDALFSRSRAALAKRRRGVDAPQRCVDAVAASVALPFDEGLAREQEFFRALVVSDQAKAQRHLFFAEREAGKIPGVTAETPVQTVKRAMVLGAGTMGAGIALCFANAGIPVTVVEANREALDRGLARMREIYAGSVQRGSLAEDEAARRLALITGALDYAAAAEADVVVEAVIEDLALKREVFAALDKIAGPATMLATNTSYQDINAIAAATTHPERVLGLHFFSPANVMRLVEVVRAEKASPAVLASGVALARKLRKVPVPVGVCDGFVGNRMLTQRNRATERLALDGAAVEEVDAAMLDFGFPMGPFAAADLAGLDISWLGRRARGTTAPFADSLCEAGRYGQKVGAGYYRYESGSRTPLPDPEVERVLAATAARLGRQRRPISRPEIVDRVLLPMINEGARILADGIALRPGDIDVIWVYGYGWPAHRGGPMFYAEQLGLATVCARLTALAQQLDDPDLLPASLLRQRAEAGQGFAGVRS